MEDRIFSDDEPKTNPWQQDELGYAPFAKRLSKLILNLHAPNGFVVGLHGAWGSGKSTVLNFVQAYIKKHNDEAGVGSPQLHVIDFRPWIISGHQNLVSGFFKVLIEAIDDKATRHAKWRRWTLRIFKGTVDPLIDAAAIVGTVADPTGSLGSTGGALAKKGVGALVDSWLEEPSLQSAYDDLKAKLAKANKRFLIIIDDIDRLDPDEIKTMLQMVKSVGRLPNVVYLLAYDRRIVWAAVNPGSSPDPRQPGYAEKIVQQELELPRPNSQALLRLLDHEIGFLIADTANSIRWHNIVQHGVRRWMRYPRDVVRLSNAVKFTSSALDGEMDSQDLLAMEGLRIFDSEVFDWIRRNRDYLMAAGLYSITSEKQRAAAASAFRDGLPAETRADILQLLATLFPGRAEELTGERMMVGGEVHYEQVRRRGICTEAGYDSYFSLHPSPNYVPKQAVDAAIQQLDDQAAQVAIIHQMVERKTEGDESLIAEYLAELQYRFVGPRGARPTQALLNALFITGDDLFRADKVVRRLSFGAWSQYHLLTSDMLQTWGPKQAGKALLAAAPLGSVEVVAAAFVDRARELGVIKSEERETRRELITKTDLRKLGEHLRPRLLGAVADGSAEQASAYYDLVRAWAYLEGNEAPKAWISAGARRSAKFLAKVSKGLLAHSIEGKRVYFVHSLPDPHLYDFELLQAAAKSHAADSSLTEDERDRVRALAGGVRNSLDAVA